MSLKTQAIAALTLWTMLLFTPMYSDAAPLELFRLTPGIGIGADVLSDVDFVRLTIEPDRFDPNACCLSFDPQLVIFSNLVFTTSDIGRTVTATADTDPQFGPVTDLFTSGVANVLLICLETGPYLAKGCNGRELNLAGLPITSWHLTIHDLTISGGLRSGSFNEVRFFTEAVADTSVSITVIPEPSTMVTVLSGMFALSLTALRGHRF